MRRLVTAGVLVAGLLGSTRTAFAQATTIVRDVRVAVGCTDWPCSPKG